MFIQDLPAFMADFGTDAVIEGQPVRGLFDMPYAEVFSTVSGNKPVLIVESSVSVTSGNSVTVNGTDYTVVGIEPDGTGMTLLRLEEV